MQAETNKNNNNKNNKNLDDNKTYSDGKLELLINKKAHKSYNKRMESKCMEMDHPKVIQKNEIVRL